MEGSAFPAQPRAGEMDTVAAVATAPGRAGLAVVRVSGPAVSAIVRVLGLPELPARRAVTAWLHHPGDGRRVDRVMATRFEAPASYTGEDVLEIGCHGGHLVPQLVLDAVCAAGARPAGPGEFARRAYLNGKLDLIQAEATLDLVDARSEAVHRAALFQLEGGLSRRIQALREKLVELHAGLAYEIDFPEEDEGPLPPERIDRATSVVREDIRSLLRRVPTGELLREGALTVVAGRPNVGKSSLFNALLGETRAIVTDVPGTTRDAIEALLSVEGYPIRLVDTAGIREEADYVEELGIEVATRYLERADLVLFCAEAGRSLEPSERAFLERRGATGRPVLRIRTKADLSPDGARDGGNRAPSGEEGANGGTSEEIFVSAREGRGLTALRAALLDSVYADLRATEESPLVLRRRQARALRKAEEELAAFTIARSAGRPPEIAAVHLREATAALEELLGVVDVEDVLDALFSRFCVGK